jgi:hypothetical protein
LDRGFNIECRGIGFGVLEFEIGYRILPGTQYQISIIRGNGSEWGDRGRGLHVVKSHVRLFPDYGGQIIAKRAFVSKIIIGSGSISNAIEDI